MVAVQYKQATHNYSTMKTMGFPNLHVSIGKHVSKETKIVSISMHLHPLLFSLQEFVNCYSSRMALCSYAKHLMKPFLTLSGIAKVRVVNKASCMVATTACK